VAATDRRVVAIAVDDAYGDPRTMLRMEVQKSGLTALPLVLRFTDWGFRAINYQYRQERPVPALLGRTRGVAKLFVQGGDRPALAAETAQLFAAAPGPKQLVRNGLGYRDMSDEDRKNYENQVVAFFLQNMSPIAQP